MADFDSSSSSDELAKLIADSYDKPLTESPPIPSGNSSPFPWLNNGGDIGGTTSNVSQPQIAPSVDKPFFEHTPQSHEQETRYYKSGPKKGQPRPPRKSDPKQANNTATHLQASSFLTGAILLTMLDMLVPMAICGLNNWRSKVKIKADDMRLSDQQKKDLQPIADGVLREMNFNASPSVLLGISLVGIYATMFATLRSESQAKMSIDEKAKKVSPKAAGEYNSQRVPNPNY